MKNILNFILVLSGSFIGTTSFGMIAIRQAASKMEYNKIHKNKSSRFTLSKAKAEGFADCQQRLEKENPKFIKSLPIDYAISSIPPLMLDVFVGAVERNKDMVINVRGTCRFMRNKFPLDDYQEIQKEIARAQSFIDGRQRFLAINVILPTASASSFRKAVYYTIAIDDQAGCCYLLEQLKQDNMLQDSLKHNPNNKFRGHVIYAAWLKRAIRKDRELIFRLLLQEDPFDAKNFYGDGIFYNKPKSIFDSLACYGDNDNFFDRFPERRKYLDLCKEYGCKTAEEMQEEELDMFADDALKRLLEECEKIEQDKEASLSSYCTLF